MGSDGFSGSHDPKTLQPHVDHEETVFDRIRSMSRLNRVALLVIACSVGIRAAWLSGTWFKEDDLVYRYRAHTQGLDLGFLFERRDGHLMPGSLLQVWVFEGLFGSSWWPIVVWCALLQAVAAWLAWVLFRALFGERPAVVVLLVALLWNPITLDSTMWWAAGMQFLPLQALFFLLLLAIRRSVSLYCDSQTLSTVPAAGSPGGKQEGLRLHLRATGVAALVLLLALAFSEKSLLLVPFAIAIFLAAPLSPGTERLATRIRSMTAPAVALTTVSVGWLVLYFSTSSNQAGTDLKGATLEQTQAAGRNLIAHTLVPGILGGPWKWLQVGVGGALAAPTRTAVNLAMVAGLAVIVLTTMRRPRVAWAWCALGIHLATLVIVLAAPGSGRLSILGPVAGLVPRYSSDSVMPALVVLGLALLRNVNEPETISDRFRLPSRLSEPRAQAQLSAAGCLCLLASSMVSSAKLVDIQQNAPAREYSRTAITSIEGTSGPVEMVAQGLPAAVASPLFFPDNGTHVLLETLSPRFQFPDVLTRPHVLTEEGRVVPARIDGVAIGDGNTCVVDVIRGAPSTVQLPGRLWTWDWYVTVAYRAVESSYLVTTLGQAEVGAPVLPGSGSVTFRLLAEGGSIDFGVLSGSVCITEIRVGVPYEDSEGE